MAQEESKEKEHPEDDSGYKVAERKSIAKIMEQDSADEALQKYKANLIGDIKKVLIDENDKRQVFFDKLMIEPEGRDPISLDPSKLKADEVAFTLKEGCKYRVRIVFRVQREIVLGLKKFDVISRKGITVDKTTQMMGAFAPSTEKSYEHPFPVEEAPSGMLYRGVYTAKTQFLDDDKTVHLAFQYQFRIGKDWSSE
ncbi:expressed hypothetical protein [Reticulomyxa filosa]|uniref:Rho GDP-dissociation inhibitor n=1 Tax=Reticulomyxa filosa TaxID=46433 RepID=X6PE17_RETFI|nr:expressed hypothetical protein [Reticulomyxa filosa]|eukprot:ETO36755.1 expressed hypothetical protein [Reticulomyxa filosa]